MLDFCFGCLARDNIVILQAFMPMAMDKLLNQLALPADTRTLAAWDRALEPGTTLPAPEGIFPRYVEKDAEAG